MIGTPTEAPIAQKMIQATLAFENFVKFHFSSEGDCKKLRRIETAIRGEELYRTFSSTPRQLRRELFYIFDYIAWCLLSFRDHQDIPKEVQKKYESCIKFFAAWRSDELTNGIATFCDFVKKYVFSVAIQNTEYFLKLPEESSNEHVRAVCDIFRVCENDVFPSFVRRPDEIPIGLRSKEVALPRDVPFFLRPPSDPLLILYDTAMILL